MVVRVSPQPFSWTGCTITAQDQRRGCPHRRRRTLRRRSGRADQRPHLQPAGTTRLHQRLHQRRITSGRTPPRQRRSPSTTSHRVAMLVTPLPRLRRHQSTTTPLSSPLRLRLRARTRPLHRRPRLRPQCRLQFPHRRRHHSRRSIMAVRLLEGCHRLLEGRRRPLPGRRLCSSLALQRLLLLRRRSQPPRSEWRCLEVANMCLRAQSSGRTSSKLTSRPEPRSAQER